MFRKIFQNKKPVIGMVHLKALPGTPACSLSWEKILDLALHDVEEVCAGGVDGIQVENQFDRPFLKPEDMGPETAAFLTAAGCAIRQRFPEIPMGMNVHLNGGMHALAAAKASGASWVRVFNLANGYISNSGYVDAAGPKIMRYRRLIDAQDIMIFGDFQVKHGSHAITSDRTLEEKAKDIEESMADAAVITGSRTGKAPDKESILQVKRTIHIPLLAGSGLNVKNVAELWGMLDGAIVGSSFKKDGDLSAPVERELVEEFVKEIPS